jgi:hypothetical protein
MGWKVTTEKRAMANPAIASNTRVICQGTVDAQKTMIAYFAPTGNDHVRCDKAVTSNTRMMPYMIATPYHNIVTNGYKRLKSIILEYKTMLPQSHIAPNKRLGADIACEHIPLVLGASADLLTDPIKLRVHNRNKYHVLPGRIPVLDLLKRYNRKAAQFRTAYMRLVDGEAYNFIR